MLGSAIWKCMSEIWAIPSPKVGGPKNTFSTSSQTVYFWNETRYKQPGKWLTTTRGLLYRLKMSWTFVHKWLKTRPALYPPSVNSAFCFIARLRRRRSANETTKLCQVVDSKSWWRGKIWTDHRSKRCESINPTRKVKHKQRTQGRQSPMMPKPGALTKVNPFTADPVKALRFAILV